MRALVWLLLALAAWGAAQGVEQPSGEATEQGNLTLAEQQFQQALALRDKADPSAKELKQAARLLRAAAGVDRIGVVRAGGASVGNATAAAGAGAGALTAGQVELVLRNASEAHIPALRELMYAYRSGDGVPANQAVAHRLLQQLAELGDGDCQTDLGFALAMGLEPLGPNSRDQLFRFVPPDIPAALVHYYFGAASGDSVAQVILGYRHLQGLGVPKSCKAAVLYYAPVAEMVVGLSQQREGLPQIRQLRLSHKTAHARQRSTEQEVLHYQWFADFGNVDAARAVAHMLTHGSLRDYEQAIYYLNQAAAAGDADAMAHLGHIYANGIAVEQSNDTALHWFWKAAEKGHPSGLFGLGYLYLSGRGLSQSYPRALKYFKQAVESPAGAWAGQGDAFFYLGLMHLNGWATKPDTARAVQLFDVASKAGNLLAGYNLAMLHLRGLTGDRDPCAAAAALLKRVAERGFTTLQEANEDFQAGEYEWALANYLKAAEMGMELGQSNAAWMLSEGYAYEGPGAGPVALMLYRRAAEQGNTDALLRLGDGYWYGKGVERDWSRAAQMYQEASKHKIGQALFNLGYMHEYGAGLPQDLHLAKRFYDRALEAQPEARLAVQVALAGLRLHGWWDSVEPRLPRSWAWLWQGLYTLSERRAPPAPHHGPPRTPWGWLREALTLDPLFEKLDAALDFDEGFDVTVIGMFAGLLLLVLWRRQTLRARQARFFPQVPAPGPAAPAPQQQAQAAEAHEAADQPAAPAAAPEQPREGPQQQPTSEAAGSAQHEEEEQQGRQQQPEWSQQQPGESQAEGSTAGDTHLQQQQQGQQQEVVGQPD